MKTTACALASAICLAFMVGVGSAEDKYGVPVYPGARYDSESSEIMKQQGDAKSAAYRTGDGVKKVIGFYRKQPGFRLDGDIMENGAVLRKGQMTVLIQRPWLNMKSARMEDNTRILIFSERR